MCVSCPQGQDEVLFCAKLGMLSVVDEAEGSSVQTWWSHVAWAPASSEALRTTEVDRAAVGWEEERL